MSLTDAPSATRLNSPAGEYPSSMTSPLIVCSPPSKFPAKYGIGSKSTPTSEMSFVTMTRSPSDRLSSEQYSESAVSASALSTMNLPGIEV